MTEPQGYPDVVDHEFAVRIRRNGTEWVYPASSEENARRQAEQHDNAEVVSRPIIAWRVDDGFEYGIKYVGPLLGANITGKVTGPWQDRAYVERLMQNDPSWMRRLVRRPARQPRALWEDA